MMEWLKEHDWVQTGGGRFAETVSFLAFVAMPGCLIGAILERLFSSK